jgi:hypothetical protein
MNGTRPEKNEEGTNFLSKRIYIAGRENQATRLTYDGFNGGKISGINCAQEETVAQNSAILVEDTLEKLAAEIDPSKLSDPIVIFAPGVFTAKIHSGEYLGYIMKGELEDGTELSKEEIEVWTSIEKLLVATHGFVCIRNISTAKAKTYNRGTNGRRVRPTFLQKKDNELQQMAWNRVPGGDENSVEEEASEEA